MSENVVEKVVNNELDMTAGLISGVKNFAVTKGVDFRRLLSSASGT